MFTPPCESFGRSEPGGFFHQRKLGAPCGVTPLCAEFCEHPCFIGDQPTQEGLKGRPAFLGARVFALIISGDGRTGMFPESDALLRATIHAARGGLRIRRMGMP